MPRNTPTLVAEPPGEAEAAGSDELVPEGGVPGREGVVRDAARGDGGQSAEESFVVKEVEGVGGVDHEPVLPIEEGCPMQDGREGVLQGLGEGSTTGGESVTGGLQLRHEAGPVSVMSCRCVAFAQRRPTSCCCEGKAQQIDPRCGGRLASTGAQRC